MAMQSHGHGTRLSSPRGELDLVSLSAMSNAQRSLHPAEFVMIPIGIAITGSLGAGYGSLTSLNPWGIANPVALIAVMFALGASTMWIIRLGHMRGELHGGLVGLVFGVSFVVGVFVITFMFDTSGKSFFAFHAGRLADGIPLFGSGSYQMKGWLLGTFWVLGSLLAAIVGFTGGIMEAVKPYCTDCNKWASRTRWRAQVFDVLPASAEAIRQRSVAALTMTQTGPPGKKKLALSVRTCRCGRVGSLTVKFNDAADEGAADKLIDAEALDPATLGRIVEWVKRQPKFDASTPPELNIVAPEENREPFVMSPTPETGEHRYGFRDGGMPRWGGYLDNDYTRALRDRLRKHDFRAAHEAIKAVKNHDDLAYVAEACGDWPRNQSFCDAWAERIPDSKLLPLIRGIHHIRLAWEARGGGWQVKNYDGFLFHIEQAEGALAQATAARPRDPNPWAWMIITSMAMGGELDELKRQFGKAVRRGPDHRFAHSFMVQALSGKWGGDDEQMLAFARAASASGSLGSNVHVCLVEAHLEAALAASRADKKATPEAYFSSPKIGTEILEANHRCFAGGKHTLTMETPRSRAWFAWGLWKSGHLEPAAEHMRIIGKTCPWQPFTSRVLLRSPNRYATARRQCRA
jgi:hypothetical protein